MDVVYGLTEPRIFTVPLRELTPATSRGFEVIAFARDVLRVSLLPWQEWLLIHMLELAEDGTLRFRKALVIVGRQNGKTLLGAILAAFWQYVDAGRWPQQVPEHEFVIVGAAQKLDIAMKPWRKVRAWGGPDDKKIGIAPDRVPMLQGATYPPRLVNGDIELRTKSGATYLPRTFEGARGHTAARLLLDELRQQYDSEGWSAIEKSQNAVFDSFMVAFSNAGTKRSKVLAGVRANAHKAVNDPETEWFVAEWSAHEEANLDDPVAFAQSNPSAGYLPGMTIKGLMRAAAEAHDKAVERVEVLSQWVTALVEPVIDQDAWNECEDGPTVDERGELEAGGSRVSASSPLVVGIDTSSDRSMSYVGVVGDSEAGKIHVETVAMRAGMLWVVPFVVALCKKQGTPFVAVQSKGCAALEFVEPLQREGLTVIRIEAGAIGSSCGRMIDRVRDRMVAHRGQPILDMAVSGAVTKKLGEVRVWDRDASGVDIAPLVAVSNALYGLENLPEIEEETPSAYETRGLMTV